MILTAITSLAGFIRLYLHEISFGITAVTIMLFGQPINNNVRKLTRKLNWLLRYVVFVVLCTVGYTVLAQIIYQGVYRLLRTSSPPMTVSITLCLFLALAWIAKEQKAI
jgi:hypothetical protein